MPRLIPLPFRVIECIFLKAGFVFERSSGSHRIYSRPGTDRPIVIPFHATTDIPVSIIAGLMRTSGMTREEYFSYLDDCR